MNALCHIDGSPGSGKSTLLKRIKFDMELELIKKNIVLLELDDIKISSEWKERKTADVSCKSLFEEKKNKYKSFKIMWFGVNIDKRFYPDLHFDFNIDSKYKILLHNDDITNYARYVLKRNKVGFSLYLEKKKEMFSFLLKHDYIIMTPDDAYDYIKHIILHE
jgi:Fe-S cluster assembly ATPase SufC